MSEGDIYDIRHNTLVTLFNAITVNVSYSYKIHIKSTEMELQNEKNPGLP